MNISRNSRMAPDSLELDRQGPFDCLAEWTKPLPLRFGYRVTSPTLRGNNARFCKEVYPSGSFFSEIDIIKQGQNA